MTRHQVFTLCFFAVVLLLLYQVALVFSPFLFPVLWAMVLAHLTFPPACPADDHLPWA